MTSKTDNTSQPKHDLDRFFEVSLEMLCIAGTNGRFYKLNPAWSQVLGYSMEELLSKPFLSLIHPDDIAPTLMELEKLKLGDHAAHFENRYLAKDGTYRLLSWAAIPDPESGKLYAAARDMTERRCKEMELQQIMSALDHSASVSVTDKNGAILNINSKYLELSRYTESEVLGKTNRIVKSGLMDPKVYTQLWQNLKEGKIWYGELQNRAKDGSVFIVQAVITPLIGIDGRVNRFFSLGFDVTKQHETRQLLMEAQSVAKIGSWSFNLNTQDLHWTDQMFELFDEERDLGPPSFDRHQASIHPNDRDSWLNSVQKCSEDGLPYRMRFRASAKGEGYYKWIEAHGLGQRDSTGTIVCLSGTCQDITAMVIAEENLQKERVLALHSAKLASLGEMSAGIAHEINNPLAIIAGTVKTMEKYLGDPDKLTAKIATLDKAVLRIIKIVDGLKKFSRTKGSRKLSSLKKIIEESLVMTEGQSRRRSVSLSMDCDESHVIDCDELEIEQVLVNLINNAIDAIQDLPEKWVSLKAFQRGEQIVLEVSDSGSGIEPAVASKIFLPFFTTKVVGKGTGLGLSIAKGILEQHQAKISILNDRPHTTFEICFPRKIEDQKAA